MKIGKYEIVGTLGEGGMAVVRKARDPKLGRFVAIKDLAGHLDNDEHALKAFQREAELLAKLSHPNIVTIYDVVEEEGRCYLVMEYVEGRTLAKLIAEGPVPPQVTVRILQEILAGLGVMHRAGILHRDLKPSNILLDQNGTVKISDFGLAERAEDEGRPMNFGSVKYMAPELYSTGESKNLSEIDPRADIYALGIISYEMLLGDKAFRAECQNIYPTETEIRKSEVPKRWMNWNMDLKQKFRPLTEVNGKVPIGLSKIVERMTAKDPSRRYPEVGAIVSDLKSVRSLEHLGPEPEEPDDDLTLPLPSKTKPETRSAQPSASHGVSGDNGRPKSRILLYAAGSVSVLVFLFLVLVLPARRRNQPVRFHFLSVPGTEVKLDEHPPDRMGDDGALAGTVRPGQHHVKFTHVGYEPYETTADVQPQQDWELKAELHKLPVVAPPVLPAGIQTSTGKMFLVPGGEFTYGSRGEKTTLPAFYIDETEVTNGAYRKFCDHTGHPYPPKPPWDEQYFDKPEYPVVNVRWDEAVDFAKWAGKRLPTELEWEKAARGTDGRAWPWGPTFEPGRANLAGQEDGFLYAAPVGSFPSGKSPYGALDMAGNVWEWVADTYHPNGKVKINIEKEKVVRGGAFLPGNDAAGATTIVWGKRGLEERPNGVGFRCAKDAPAPASLPPSTAVSEGAADKHL